MKSNYKRLGDYIREVVEINKNLEVTRLRGISSVYKCLIESKANTIGVDFSSYKILRKGQFSYNPNTARMGDKIPVALNDEEDCIVSKIYPVFEINDENKLNPEYLMMWFRREEFDRYARYMSHGSAREVFSWEEMCNVKIPIPSIEKQKEIVKEYNIILDKIDLNNKLMKNLEDIGMEIYNKLFYNSDDNLNEKRVCSLKDIATITMGQSPEGTSYNNECLGEIFYQGRTDFGFRFPKVTTYTTKPKKMAYEGDILISVRAPVGDLNIATDKCCIGRGIASINSIQDYNSYIFYYLKSQKDKFSISNEEGTIFGSIKKTDLEELKINYCEEKIIEFEKMIKPIDKKIKICSSQNKLLLSIRDLLYAKMIN